MIFFSTYDLYTNELFVAHVFIRHSDGESELLGALRAETLSTYTERMSRMISGPLQGRLLSMLATVSRAHKVLELGTFTGYATLSFAEGIAANIKAGLVKEQEAKIYSCDHDEKSLAIARKYVDKSEWGHLVIGDIPILIVIPLIA